MIILVRFLRMRKLYLFIVLVMAVKQSFSQNKKTDSLWAVYNNKNQTDTNRLKAIFTIARGYVYNNPDTAIILAEQELGLAQQSQQKKYEANAFNIIGASYMGKGSYPKALEYYLKALKVYEEIKERASWRDIKIGFYGAYECNCLRTCESDQG